MNAWCFCLKTDCSDKYQYRYIWSLIFCQLFQLYLSAHWCIGQALVYTWKFYWTRSVRVLLLKAGATVHQHPVLTGVTHSICPPHLFSAYNKVSLSPLCPPWQVSRPTAASPKTTRPDSRETGESWLHNKDLLWWWNVLQGPKHSLKEISPSDKGSLTLAPEPRGKGRRWEGRGGS